MALLNDYSADNMITERGLAIRYAAQRVKVRQEVQQDGNTTTKEVWMWQISRYATKSYSFIGMEINAATYCATQKTKQYQRLYSRGEDAVVESGASVEIVRDGDSTAYSVTVQVNETDVLLRETYGGNPELLFAAQNQRNYDEGSPKEDYSDYELWLTAIHRTGGALDGLNYFAGLADFRVDRCYVHCNTTTSPLASWSDGTFADMGLGVLNVWLEYKRYDSMGRETDPIYSNHLVIDAVQSENDTGAAEYNFNRS